MREKVLKNSYGGRSELARWWESGTTVVERNSHGGGSLLAPSGMFFVKEFARIT